MLRRTFLIALFAIAVSPAVAQASVTVTTDNATSVGITTMTLNGHGVCDASSTCAGYSQYWINGTTTIYATPTTTVSSCGSGGSCNWTLSQPVAGLQENTLYDYRACATENGGAAVCGGTLASQTHTGDTVGASQATCSSPNPCSTSGGTVTTVNLSNVSNDDGTTSSRTYYVYRPPGLAASQTNRPPAMLTFGGSAGACTEGFRSDLEALAAMQRFVIVELTCLGGNWRKEWVNSIGRTTPDDEPYVKAVVNDITSCPTSPAANQCMDSVRLYANGGSSGGNMVADLMCDGGSASTTNDSTLFRGYLIDSSSLQLYSGSPDCPSTNTSYFGMIAISNEGADNGLYYDTLANPHFDIDQTGTHFQYWLKAKLGCTSSQTYDSPWTPVRRYRFSGPCNFALGGDAVEALGVINGGHTWTCQDSNATWTPANQCTDTLSPVGLGSDGRPQTGGLWVEQEFWRFVDVGVSP